MPMGSSKMEIKDIPPGETFVSLVKLYQLRITY